MTSLIVMAASSNCLVEHERSIFMTSSLEKGKYDRQLICMLTNDDGRLDVHCNYSSPSTDSRSVVLVKTSSPISLLCFFEVSTT